MEYENRYRPTWIQLFGLICYSVAIIYTVLVNNPYLYSSKKFQEGLAGKKDNSYQPVFFDEPPLKKEDLKLKTPNRMGWDRISAENSGETRDRRYVELTLTPLFIELDKKLNQVHWKLLNNAVIMFDETGTVRASNLEGQTLWTFSSEFTSGSSFFTDPLVDQKLIYLIHPKGHIYALELETGKLRWTTRIEGHFLSDAFSTDENMYIVKQTKVMTDKKKTSLLTQLIKIHRESGKILESSEDLNLKQNTELSYSSEEKLLFLASAERLIAVSMPSMKIQWQKNLSSPVIGPTVLADGKALVALKEGKHKTFQLARGSEIHETDLEHPLASPPSYIPIYNRAVLTTTDSYQHVVDLDSGNRLWRFDLNNKNNIQDPWSARLSGNFIEELQMKWKFKGWTIWSPCVEKRICIYNPEKGQIVGRVMLSGSLSSLPIFLDRSFYVILEQEGGYTLARYMEEPAAKKNL